MTALPELRLGIFNVWMFLLVYAGGFLLALAAFSKDEKARLFADPKLSLRGIKRVLLHIGQLVALTFVIIMVLTPITRAFGLMAVGLGVFLLGYCTVLVSLRYFRRAAEGQPATDGPYRVSRNPQWVGLFLVLLGAAITSGAWLMIVMVLVVGCIYHLQILEEEKACTAMYGGAYIRYLRQVPRYFLSF
jgi:protein-S-isoprenylcysteine O-methyltransferase Ste14